MSGFLLKIFGLGDSVVIPPVGSVVVRANAQGELEVTQSDGSKKQTGFFRERNSLSINTARNGVVAGLRIQETSLAGSLNGKTIEIQGQVKLVVGTQSSTNFIKVRVGGLVFQFANFTALVGTIYQNFRIMISCPTPALGFGYCNISGGTVGTTNAVSEMAATATGAITDNSVEVLIGTPTAITVTNNFSKIEVY